MRYSTCAGSRCLLVVVAVLLLSATQLYAAELKVYAGSTARFPIQELAKQYQSRTGVTVTVVADVPANLIPQMAKSKSGDVYIPGSVAMMKAGAKQGVVAANAGDTIAYLAPAIIVAKGNPKHVRTLNDLANPGVRVALKASEAGPEEPCLGAIAANMLQTAHLADKVKPNTVSVAECNQLASAVRQGKADATIAWTFFATRFPNELEAVALPSDVAKPRPIPAAVTSFASDPKAARAFIDFLRSPAAQQVFAKQGYVPLNKAK